MRVTVYLSRSSVASDDDAANHAMDGAACALAAAAGAVDVAVVAAIMPAMPIVVLSIGCSRLDQ